MASPTLRFDVETVFRVAAHDFTDFIVAVYGPTCRYEFEPDQEVGHDEEKRFVVPQGEQLDPYDAKRLDALRAGAWPGFITRTVLQDLVNQHLLAPGTYLIYTD